MNEHSYFKLKDKSEEIKDCIVSHGFDCLCDWYSGHYQKDEAGNWVKEEKAIPVISVKNVADIEIECDTISVSTKMKKKQALAYSFQSIMKYTFEVYGVENYLTDFYEQGLSLQECKNRIMKSHEEEIGFSFVFPFDVKKEYIIELLVLLHDEGFYK